MRGFKSDSIRLLPGFSMGIKAARSGCACGRQLGAKEFGLGVCTGESSLVPLRERGKGEGETSDVRAPVVSEEERGVWPAGP